MPADADGDDSFDLADHVVASSEREPPEETVERLFGEFDPRDGERAQETVAALFDAADAVSDTDADSETTVPREATALLEPDGETRHEVHVAGDVEYAHCVDGALAAALLAEADQATVRSLDPVSGAPVTFDLDGDPVRIAPEAAVVGMGMAEDLPASADLIGLGVGAVTGDGRPEASVDDPHETICANFNAFEQPRTYETWADEVDAVSVAVPAVVFVGMIRELVPEHADD